MVWKFFLLCFLTELIVILGHKLIDRISELREEKEVSLLELFESGQLKTNKSIPEQIDEMIREAENSGYSEIELEIDTDMTLVDIEAVKRKLRAKNERLKELVLEIK